MEVATEGVNTERSDQDELPFSHLHSVLTNEIHWTYICVGSSLDAPIAAGDAAGQGTCYAGIDACRAHRLYSRFRGLNTPRRSRGPPPAGHRGRPARPAKPAPRCATLGVATYTVGH